MVSGKETVWKRIWRHWDAEQRSIKAAAKLTTVEKNRGLEFVAEELCLRKEELLSENEKDMEAAREQGMSEALQDRLRLTQARIEAMDGRFETDLQGFQIRSGKSFP